MPDMGLAGIPQCSHIEHTFLLLCRSLPLNPLKQFLRVQAHNEDTMEVLPLRSIERQCPVRGIKLREWLVINISAKHELTAEST